MHREPLLPLFVRGSEGHPVGEVLDRVAVQVDLELVAALRVESGDGDVTAERVADVDHQDGAGLTGEQVQVGDVEPDILTRQR
jgi:hypothetical protein